MSTAHRRSLSSTTQPLIVGGKLYLGYRAAENTGAPIALTSTHGSWGPGFYYPNLRYWVHESFLILSLLVWVHESFLILFSFM